MNAKRGLSKSELDVSHPYLDALQAAYGKGLMKLEEAVKALGDLSTVTNIEVTTKDDVVHCEATVRVPIPRVEGTFVITNPPTKSELPWEGWPLGNPRGDSGFRG